jgi:hypothetical protein
VLNCESPGFSHGEFQDTQKLPMIYLDEDGSVRIDTHCGEIDDDLANVRGTVGRFQYQVAPTYHPSPSERATCPGTPGIGIL